MRGKAFGLAAFGLAAFVLGIGVWRPGTMTSTACQAVEPGREGSSLDGTRPFPLSYEVARERFLQAARTAAGTVESIQSSQNGPNGKPLFMDVARLGAEDAQRTLVVNSGTHGVEGFAGSGIQTALLREEIGSRLPAGTSLLLIHGINPYGMAHLRRVNEDNVDLNRNFRDHAAGHPGEFRVLGNSESPEEYSVG